MTFPDGRPSGWIDCGAALCRLLRGAAIFRARPGPALALRSALAGGIALAATSAIAAPLLCRDDHALYRPTTNERYIIEFFRGFDNPQINRAGVLRYRGKAGVFEYEFAIRWSVGFPRPSFWIIENSSAPRDPEQDDNEELKDIGVGGRMIMLAEDFGPHKGGWPTFLVFPDFTEEFRLWFKELAKHPDQLPPEAWKLVPCSKNADARAKRGLPPAGPPVLWWRYEQGPASWRLPEAWR
jgi:hypothetical protein